MMEKMQRVLNPDKINQYIRIHLGDEKQLKASVLPLETTEDFVKMIYVRLYGQRKNMEYSVAVMEDVEVNGFRFKDFLITKKE